mmetsp:Transcript_2616/g.8941  ORF Transcript_2616/g.8941 Transcript_2616/m.8941 type:complete len:250 (+) Transcript_2616:1443-2192(+)
MGQGLGCGDPPPGVEGEHFEHDVLGAFGDLGPRRLFQVQLEAQDLVEDGALRGAPEGWLAAQQDVHDHPDRPHVRAGSVAPLQDLRRDVVRAAHHIGELGPRPEELREPKVDGLDPRVVRVVDEQKVFGLEVPMDHAVEVALRDDPQHLLHKHRGVLLRVVALGNDLVEELPAPALLHHDVDVVVVLVRPAKRHDVVVPRQALQDGDLPLGVLHAVRAHQAPLRDRLHRVVCPGILVLAPVRHPELPPA